jgi:hypothetical protein
MFNRSNSILLILKISAFIFFLTLYSCGSKGGKQFQALKLKQEVKEEHHTTSLTIRYCPKAGEEIDSVNLVIFTVDFSGSNLGRGGGCFTGTDPESKRIKEIASFIKTQTSSKKDKLYFAIIPFGTNSVEQCYRLFNNGQSKFVQYDSTTMDFKDPPAQEEAYYDWLSEKHEIFSIVNKLRKDPKESFLPVSCKGWTNYLSGLEAMSDVKSNFINYMKQQYPENGSKSATIFINSLFLSDGAPLVQGGSSNQGVQQKDIEIFTKIYDFIMNNNDRSQSKIKDIYSFMSTAYYTAPYELFPGKDPSSCTVPTDQDARQSVRPRKCKKYTGTGSRLCDMSDIGYGVYFDLKNNPTYADFKLSTLYNSYITDKIIAYNRQGHWDESNNAAVYSRDEDGDGLSDELEEQLGSDSFKEDSDSDGIRDSVEYFLTKTTDDFNAFSCPGTPVDTDLDGIYDCEEKALGSDPKRSDMNLNGIPDFMDLINGNPLLSTNSSMDIDGDGMSNLQEIYQNLPLNIPNKLLPLNLEAQTETTSIYNTENSCMETTYKNFRVSSLTSTFNVDLWYYATQKQGNLKQLNKTKINLTPGTNTVIDADKLTKEVSYEGN